MFTGQMLKKTHACVINGSQPFVRENTGKMVSSGGGRGERKKKNRLFPSKNWEKLAKISKIEVLIMA